MGRRLIGGVTFRVSASHDTTQGTVRDGEWEAHERPMGGTGCKPAPFSCFWRAGRNAGSPGLRMPQMRRVPALQGRSKRVGSWSSGFGNGRGSIDGVIVDAAGAAMRKVMCSARREKREKQTPIRALSRFRWRQSWDVAFRSSFIKL